MFKVNDKDKNNKVKKEVDNLNKNIQWEVLSESLEKNINILKSLFIDNDTVKYRNVKSNYNDNLEFCIIYCDGVVDSFIMEEHILGPLRNIKNVPQNIDCADFIYENIVKINDGKKTSKIKEIINGITYGDTLLLINNSSEALLLNTKKFVTRSISEPDGERILSGPREGFSEALMVNLSLIRRKVRTNDLKMKFYTLGERTQTQICVMYLDTLVNKDILKDFTKRINDLNIDGILDENYITEQIRDKRLSPFRSVGHTERPDVVVGKLLEGRIAMLVDGSPVAVTVPFLFIENFQSNEDYYLNYYYSSFSRFLRMLGFMLTILIPSVYIVIVAYYHELLPEKLLVSMVIQHQSVPLPAAVEAFLMLLMFDLLRETGIRMPSNVGQALSIVGALVIGQAAVEAMLISAPIIIMVAVTGITGLLIPKMRSCIIFGRMAIFTLSSFLGPLGFCLGVAMLFIHILNLESFGISQFVPDRELTFQEVKDTTIRAPWWEMKSRPHLMVSDEIRQKNNKENKKS